MAMDYFKRVSAQTATDFWVNNVTTEQAKLGIEAGAVGATQNPAYMSKIVGSSSDAKEVDEMIAKLISEESDDSEVLARLQSEQIDRIAEIFMPVYEKSGHKEGYVSIQANPFKENTKDIVKYAHMYRANFPNIICKIPVVKESLAGLEQLMRERVPVLATEVMSLDQALVLNEIVEKVSADIPDMAPILMAHIAGIFDEQLQADVKDGNIDVSTDALWQAGVAVAKKIKTILDAKQSKIVFMDGGARGLHHFTEMVGVSGYVTINWKGTADVLLEQDPVVIDRFNAPVSPTVIDELIDKVPNFKKAYEYKGLSVEEFESFPPVVRFRNSFEKGWLSAVDYIKKYRADHS